MRSSAKIRANCNVEKDFFFIYDCLRRQKKTPKRCERPESTGSKIMSSLGSLISVNILGVDSCVFSIFTTRVRKHFGNSGRFGPLNVAKKIQSKIQRENWYGNYPGHEDG